MASRYDLEFSMAAFDAAKPRGAPADFRTGGEYTDLRPDQFVAMQEVGVEFVAKLVEIAKGASGGRPTGK